MSHRQRVRFYTEAGNKDKPLTVVGLSENAREHRASIEEFLGSAGHLVNECAGPDYSPSCEHLRIVPPIEDEELIQRLGQFCAGLGTKKSPVHVVDNREKLPQPLGKGFFGGSLIAYTTFAV